MSELEFHVEFFIEIPEIEEKLLTETRQRLQDLTENRNDFVGASVSIEDIAGVDNRFLYQARIVAYIKPENIAVVEKRESPEAALNEALSTIEKRVREERSKHRKVWQHPDKQTRLSVTELTSHEVHDTYVGKVIPDEMLEFGRDSIATKLMMDEKMDQESAYYAADRILEYAQTRSTKK